MTKKTHDIKVGDTVEVITTEGNTHKAHKVGNRHKVVWVESDCFGEDIIHVDAGYGAYPHRFRKVAHKFKKGDRVRRTKEFHNGMRPGDTDTVVECREHGVDLLHSGKGHMPSNLELVAHAPKNASTVIIAAEAGTTSWLRKAPKKKAPVSVKVTQADANEALTKYVKETLGIDATVTSIIQSFGSAVELVLKQEAQTA